MAPKKNTRRNNRKNDYETMFDKLDEQIDKLTEKKKKDEIQRTQIYETLNQFRDTLQAYRDKLFATEAKISDLQAESEKYRVEEDKRYDKLREEVKTVGLKIDAAIEDAKRNISADLKEHLTEYFTEHSTPLIKSLIDKEADELRDLRQQTIADRAAIQAVLKEYGEAKTNVEAEVGVLRGEVKDIKVTFNATIIDVKNEAREAIAEMEELTKKYDKMVDDVKNVYMGKVVDKLRSHKTELMSKLTNVEEDTQESIKTLEDKTLPNLKAEVGADLKRLKEDFGKVASKLDERLDGLDAKINSSESALRGQLTANEQMTDSRLTEIKNSTESHLDELEKRSKDYVDGISGNVTKELGQQRESLEGLKTATSRLETAGREQGERMAERISAIGGELKDLREAFKSTADTYDADLNELDKNLKDLAAGVMTKSEVTDRLRMVTDAQRVTFDKKINAAREEIKDYADKNLEEFKKETIPRLELKEREDGRLAEVESRLDELDKKLTRIGRIFGEAVKGE